MVHSVVAPPATVLDVAAAQGNFSLKLAEEGYKVTWNDLRDELIDYVKQKYERGSIEYAAGNIFEVGAPEQFDLVLATEVIEHVAHPDQFLMKLAALGKPGGYIVLTTPNGEYFRNTLPKFSQCPDPSQYEKHQFQPNAEGHIFLLHEDELRMLAEKAKLKVRELRLFTSPITNGHMKTGALLNILPKQAIDVNEKLTQQLPEAIKRKLCVQMGAILQKSD